MIFVEDSEIKLKGDLDKRAGELALAIHVVTKTIAEQVGGEQSVILEHVLTSASLYPLVDSGMSLLEAMRVVGIPEHKLDIERSGMPEEDKEEIRKARA